MVSQPSLRLSADDCQKKADDCRALAKNAIDPTHKIMLGHEAETWDRIAADMAKRHAGGRVVSMLEGGYNLTALARSVAVHVKTLMDVGA